MSERVHSRRDDRSLPGTTKLGLTVMAFGLLFDVVEHGFIDHAGEPAVGAFPVAEHAAHLIVLIGMVLVLVGIVADGMRRNRSTPELRHRPRQHTGRQSHALR